MNTDKLTASIQTLDRALRTGAYESEWTTIKDGVRGLIEENEKLDEGYTICLNDKSDLIGEINSLRVSKEYLIEENKELRGNLNQFDKTKSNPSELPPDGYPSPSQAKAARQANIIFHLVRAIGLIEDSKAVG